MKPVTTQQELEAELKAHPKVIVDCHALWCDPCKQMAPVAEKLNTELENVHFVSMDIDEAEELAAELGVVKLPTFLVFQDGALSDTLVGQDKAALTTMATTLNLGDDAFSNIDF